MPKKGKFKMANIINGFNAVNPLSYTQPKSIGLDDATKSDGKSFGELMKSLIESDGTKVADGNRICGTIKDGEDVVRYSTNQGATWKEMLLSQIPLNINITPMSENADIHRASGVSSSDNKYAAENVDGVLRYTEDYSATWSEVIPAGFPVELLALLFKKEDETTTI